MHNHDLILMHARFHLKIFKQYCLLERINIPDIRYTGICSDTGIGDMYNSKIPIYRTFGISLRDTVCRIQTLLQVKPALCL